LIKIMLGLFEPTDGEVRIDGLAMSAFGVRAYRRQIATVMQDDQLLSGTILQNICFFDDFPDHAWASECARLACIHEEIMRLPMGYRTLIGGLGSSLSAGQRQRVLLARALYRRPSILFIDEGTANLDVDLEKRINQMLRTLPITRIQIAHRRKPLPSPIASFTSGGRQRWSPNCDCWPPSDKRAIGEGGGALEDRESATAAAQKSGLSACGTAVSFAS
jgi:ATP-binding cassette, subfamily B, bacterial CvaB/MchF/RaxB